MQVLSKHALTKFIGRSDNKLPKLKLAAKADPKKALKAFEQLIGYPIQTELDRELIAGIFGTAKIRKISQEHL